MIGLNLRPLPRILARFAGFDRRRPYAFTADVLALWRIAGYAPPSASILTEVGPVHLTLAAHESLRAYSLPIVGWHGVFFVNQRDTWTLTLIAFCFTLTLQFCHTPNIERVEVTQIEHSVYSPRRKGARMKSRI